MRPCKVCDGRADLIGHCPGLGTHVDQEDGGQGQLQIQGQSVPCRHRPGPLNMGVLSQSTDTHTKQHLVCELTVVADTCTHTHAYR